MRSVSGYYKGIKVLAVSTGMGGASTGIAVEELHNIGALEAFVKEESKYNNIIKRRGYYE
jgi:uridine phosphorylase